MEIVIRMSDAEVRQFGGTDGALREARRRALVTATAARKQLEPTYSKRRDRKSGLHIITFVTPAP